MMLLLPLLRQWSMLSSVLLLLLLLLLLTPQQSARLLRPRQLSREVAVSHVPSPLAVDPPGMPKHSTICPSGWGGGQGRSARSSDGRRVIAVDAGIRIIVLRHRRRSLQIVDPGDRRSSWEQSHRSNRIEDA